ncbi:hypothetical protein [Pseudarthrobacter sp. ATCC 49987]|uniref:hypothetical protein n=1 Tax=Pseudarthrobacter sp. ATCC 49987 TaxID=2698204 RepID=UPI00136F9866|nr:hypothetical protein [Pseudarthrobacter sp. ATCC 49987]
MSCHHRHGPWCCDDYYYAPAGYATQSYAAPPLPYPPPGYAPMPPASRRPNRRRDQEDLSTYLEFLEGELAQVREQIAAMNPDAETKN